MHDAPFHLKRLPNLARVVFVGMVEWLRRQPRKLLPFGRMGSNPISDVHFFFFPTSSPFCFRLIPHLLAGFSVIFRSFFAIPDLFTARFHLIGKRAFLWYRTCVACIRGVCMWAVCSMGRMKQHFFLSFFPDFQGTRNPFPPNSGPGSSSGHFTANRQRRCFVFNTLANWAKNTFYENTRILSVRNWQYLRWKSKVALTN